MSTSKVKQLKDLLQLERVALMSGDFAALEGLLPEKEHLMRSLESAQPIDLDTLSADLSVNERLFSAAREGVSDVIETLENKRKAQTSLSTYDENGKPAKIVTAQAGTERRY